MKEINFEDIMNDFVDIKSFKIGKIKKSNYVICNTLKFWGTYLIFLATWDYYEKIWGLYFLD